MNFKTKYAQVRYSILALTFILMSLPKLSSQSMKTFHFGHSLVQHDNEYSNLFHWMYELSVEAGYTYALEGQFGFLANQGTPPNLNMGSTINNTSAWDTDFATSDFDNTVITAAYYAHYEFNCWENAYGVVRLDELHRLVDFARGETPDIKVYLYATWTEPGEPTTMTTSDFEFFKNDSRALHDWWIRTQDTLNGSRANLDAKIIPVGQVLADALDNVNGLDVLNPTDLFVDDAGHGTPTFYFMAAMVHYMARWGEQCPSSYTVPNNIHQAVRDNYAALITYIWNELQTYNYPDGSSRVFFSTDNTAPTVPDGLTSTDTTGTTVTLSWNPSIDDNSVSSYRVYTDGANPITVAGTSVTISGLMPNTTYSFTLSAGDLAGNWSSQSLALQVTTSNVAVYTLTVNSGTGDGDYSEGTTVIVSADVPTTGFEFNTWTGDVQYLASVTSASTSLTMPASDASISATYTAIETGDTITIQAEDYTNMSGIQTEASTDVGGGQQVGYIDNSDWIEFEIDFPSAGNYNIAYRISSEGSIGDMSVTIEGLNPTYVDIPNSGSFETFTTVWGEINVQNTGVQTLRITSIGSGWNINWIKLVPIIAIKTYTLTVNKGSGDGDYAEGAVVEITADTPDPGYQFDTWIGDISLLADASLSTNSFTMPSNALSITATYKEIATTISQNEYAIQIYPNPASNFVFISADVTIRSMQLVNITGNVVLETILNSRLSQVNIDQIPGGIYFLHVYIEDNSHQYIRFVKQ